MRGANPDRPPMVEPLALTDRGTAEEIAGRPDSDIEEWDTEWAAEKAAAAMRFLAEHYPECGGSDVLHPHQDQAHAAAVVGDRHAYLQALRRYMRAGLGVAIRARLRARKGAA